MSDLADFLLARLAEDEEGARGPEAERLLAECEERRAIVSAYLAFSRLSDAPLRHLALLYYADHPDYREEWKP